MPEPDLLYPILCTIMQRGNEADFNFLANMYDTTPETNPDKLKYLKSLFCNTKINDERYVSAITIGQKPKQILVFLENTSSIL